MKLFIELGCREMLDKYGPGVVSLILINKKQIMQIEHTTCVGSYFVTLKNNKSYLVENQQQEMQSLIEELKKIEI